MEEAGFRPLIVRQAGEANIPIEKIVYWASLYDEVEKHPAWKDFMHRLHQMKQGTVQQLLTHGGLDNEGNTHDIELRAVLHCLNTILGYVPAMRDLYTDRMNRLQDAENRRKWKSTAPIHGAG